MLFCGGGCGGVLLLCIGVRVFVFVVFPYWLSCCLICLRVCVVALCVLVWCCCLLLFDVAWLGVGWCMLCCGLIVVGVRLLCVCEIAVSVC